MDIIVDKKTAGLARVEINRPQVKNALNKAALTRLAEVFEELQGDRDTRVIALSGRDGFCAGADLAELAVIDGAVQREEFFKGFARTIAAMIACPQPIVGVVRGAGVAGGCGLVAACDLVVAASDAKFGIPEIKLGLAPLIVMSVIQRVIGVRAAMELALFGELISADDARKLGLLNRVVDAGDLEKVSEEMIGKLLALSAPALAATKRASYAISDTEISKLLTRLPKEIAVLSISEESTKLVGKFLEKGRK